MKETPFGKIPDDWGLDTIINVTELVTDYVANGSFKSLADNVQYQEDEDSTVLIRLVDYNNGFNGKFVYVNDHAYEFLSKSKLYGNEIIISNVGANVGTVFRCPRLNKQMTLGPNSVMLKFKENDDFYYYWIKSPFGQHMLQSIVTGSAQPKFNKTNLRQVLVPIPPLDLQKKIADILSCLDKKIETNEKINRNLQDQALAIYHKMFVEAKNESRTTCRTDEFFDITIGKTPPRKEKEWFSDVPSECVWISISDMGSSGTFINDSSEYLTPEAVEKFNVKVVPDNTVILSFKLTVGRIAITVGPTTTNEAIAHFSTGNEKVVEYLYCYLKSFDFGALGSTSSIGTAVNSKTIKAMDFVIPEDGELREFYDIVHPMFQQIKNNQFENQRLIAMRDSLLPKLMSGELDVSDIEL